MKILFICGALEPGKDGVGDYTRRLACELIRRKNQVALVAINDKFIENRWQGYHQEADVKINVLRLSSSLSWKIRVQKIRYLVKNFNPDWLSLQYVPFSFNKRGLPFWFANRLKQVSTNKNWHIMFHELWVGMNRESSFKHYLWGKIQKTIIRSLIANLRPKIIHTQTRLYQDQLIKMGFNTLYLPLFSNIKLEERAIKLSNTSQCHKHKKFVIFGMVQEDCPIADFVKEVNQYSKDKGEKIEFIFIGRSGQRLDAWVNILQTGEISFKVLGEQSSVVISSILLNADYGISTTPLAQIEKSGTVAAMREHGLPVICIGRRWSPRGLKRIDVANGIYGYQKYKLEKIFESSSNYLKSFNFSDDSLSETANLFLNDVLSSK